MSLEVGCEPNDDIIYELNPKNAWDVTMDAI